jgi:bifunctional non-homologous end joining protein LigD
MSLRRYRERRDLEKSPEPSGKQAKGKKRALKFVVQRHAARHLHYDLRLEMEGVLKSWAIPKGPSLDPSVKRLAVHVEDHPLDYATFSGIIPKGHYGAGTVEIWDHGTYTAAPSSNMPLADQLNKGEIKFVLEGEKLKGEFVLVRLKKEEDQWLLIKKRDPFAQPGHGAEAQGEMPHHVSPMLATLTDKAFDSKEWIFEIKWDGYRALSEISHGKAEIYSRNFHSFSTQFPTLVKELRTFKQELLLDGEIVILNKEGKPDFQLLQNYLKSGKGGDSLRYFVFDLLYLNGKDLRETPLIERKARLKEVMSSHPLTHVLYNDHMAERGCEFFAEVKKQGMEGVIAKHCLSHYASKRSRQWLKIKVKERTEAIICGFTEPTGSRKKFGALLLGMYVDGQLVFIGHAGGGLSDKSLEEIHQRLQKLVTSKSPFKEPPVTNTRATWVKPTLVCEVEFQEWTDGGIMRQPIFKGLRMDKKSRKSRSFISNPGKVYWPKEGYTKGDLLDYYDRIAPHILPYLKKRPLVLHRFPDGIEGKEFYQKEAPDSTPDWMQTVDVEHTEKTIHYLTVKDKRSLLYVVNLGCIEIHPFNSQVSKIDNPDYLVLDLDPEGISFHHVVEVAQVLHKLLDEIGLPNYCKTSGKRGLHLLIPLGKKYTSEQAEMFAKVLAKAAHAELPETTSLIRDPKKREGKVYIDYLQNSRTKTIVSAYSVRPVPGAFVSAPLEWSEVSGSLDPSRFTMNNIIERIKEIGDPMLPLLKEKIDMAKALSKLENLGVVA